jgi:CheY-like chemotaxis protein
VEPKRTRILVVDDEPKLGAVIAHILAPEHDVLVLTSAQEALDRIAGGEHFDLILCDLFMPHVDGVRFHECVSSIAPALVERIVIMTAGAFTQRTVAFLDRPSVCRLDKPFEPAQLRRLVRERLRL